MTAVYERMKRQVKHSEVHMTLHQMKELLNDRFGFFKSVKKYSHAMSALRLLVAMIISPAHTGYEAISS